MKTGKTVAEEYDADGQFGEAIKALRDAAWLLRVAAYALEEEYQTLPTATYRPVELGACMAVADLLGAQVEAIGTQARRLRKRARDI